jgi:uncharacterized protein (TIGR03435 family)
MLAYDVTPKQISGVPGALDNVGYDIVATCDRPMTKESAGRMLETLLADRFKLAVHREEKELPIYALVIGKGGSKHHESPAGDTGPPERKRNGSAFVFSRTPMSSLALILSQLVGRTVLDKTELSSRYDFTLEYAPERTGRGRDGEALADTDGPSIFAALQYLSRCTKALMQRDCVDCPSTSHACATTAERRHQMVYLNNRPLCLST